MSISIAYTVRIPEEDDKTLTLLAKQMERNKAYLIRKAVKNYIQHLKEDQEDLNDALKALEKSTTNITWAEVQRNCDLLED